MSELAADTVQETDQATVVPTIRKGRSRESQGRHWQKVSDIVDKLIATRPSDHISSYLAELRELDVSRKRPSSYYQKRPTLMPLGDEVLKDFGRTTQDGFYYPNVVGGRYLPSTISPIRYLMGCVRKDTRAIVELGSGWSCNLFQIYVGIGKTNSKRIGFFSAEYTREGRDCATKLATHDGDIKHRAIAFDYRQPNLAFLEKVNGHILVFTRHSVEQVETIDPSLYDILHRLQASVSLVHIEPVGWQRDSALMERRLAGDSAYFAELGRHIVQDINSESRQIENAAWWSWRLGYNVNLTAMMEDTVQNGRARLVRREYDFSGIANVLNPASLYHLEFIKPS